MSTRLAHWLQQRTRASKYALLLIAAWAPFLLSNAPLWAGLLMTGAASLFWLSTRTAAISEPNDGSGDERT